MNWSSIALFDHPAKAEPIRRRLVQAGIAAEIRGEPFLRRFWFVSKGEAGARIEVPAGHFERAEQLLLDWDAAEGALREAIRCPECQALRVLYPQFARNSLLTNLALGLLATTGFVPKEFYCEDCHFTWPKAGAAPRRDRPHLAPYYFIDGVDQTILPPQTPAPAARRRAA